MDKFVEVLVDYGINKDKIRVIADIGAEDGSDSVALMKFFPHASFFLIEGLKENYEGYLKNLNNVNSFHAVITDYDGEIDFNENQTQGLHSIYQSHWSPVKKKHKSTCYRFDTFLVKNHLPVPDLVKIDVEGASFEAIRGFGEFLDKVKIIQIETETEAPRQRPHSKSICRHDPAVLSKAGSSR